MRLPAPTKLMFWHAGGSICGSEGLALNTAQAVSLRCFYLEQGAFQTDPDGLAFCTRASRELLSAIQAAEAWRRASRPLAA